MKQASLYDQQVVRDRGDDFRKRTRQAIKRFELFVQPFKTALREILTEIFANFVPIEETIKQELVNTCYYRYFTKFEDAHFRFLLKSFNYLFDSKNNIEFYSELNYKYIGIIFFEQLRQQLEQDRKAHVLFERLMAMKREKEQEEPAEGFWSADEDSDIDSQGKTIRRKKDEVKNKENEFCYTKKDLHLKDLQISSLLQKLQYREQNLVQITAGYIKDVQLLREQLYRKDQTQMGYQESYEVSYMDFTAVLDPTIKALLNSYIQDLKLQFEKRTIDYVKIMQNQKTEISQLKAYIQKLQNQLNTIDAPSDTIRKLLEYESNPYRIWKYIADVKGNFYFKEVFEIQKAIYGINYSEINHLMMTSKAYEREYQLYREQTTAEMMSFFEKALKEIEGNRCELIGLQKYKETTEKRIAESRQELYEQVMKEFKIQEEQRIKLLEEQQKQLDQEQIIELDKLKFKYAVKFWRLVATQKNENFVNQIRQGTFLDEIKQGYEFQIKQLKEQVAFEQKQNSSLIVQVQQLQQTAERQEREYQDQRQHYDDLQQSNTENAKLLRQTDLQKQLIEMNLQRIIKLIDPKLAAQAKELNLDDKQRESVKSFVNSVKALSQQTMRAIQEVKVQSMLNDNAFKSLILNKYFDQEVQTDIADINVNVGIIVQTQQNTIQHSLHDESQLPSENQRLDEKATNLRSIEKNKTQRTNHPKYESGRTSQAVDNQLANNPFTTTPNQNINPALKTPLEKLKGKYTNQTIHQTINQTNSNENETTAIKNPLDSTLIKQTVSEDQQEFIADSASMVKSKHRKIREARDQLSQLNKDHQIDQHSRTLYNTKKAEIHETSSKAKSSSLPQRTKKRADIITKEPFNHLYKDSFEKQERIRELRNNLELLEKSHWDELIVLFSQMSQKNSYSIQDVPPSPKKQEFTYNEGISYSAQCYRKYYDRVKSKTPNQNRYKSWIIRQTGQIDKMLGVTDSISQQYVEVSRRLSQTSDWPKIHNSTRIH